MNIVLPTFSEEPAMIRAVAEEAIALASLSLFMGMIAVWAHILIVL